MKLTHHEKHNRSFIIIFVIILCVVFTALVLIRIQNLYNLETSKNIAPNIEQRQEEPTFNQTVDESTGMKTVSENGYPMQIKIPVDWNVKGDETLSEIRHLILTSPSGNNSISIFVSKKSYAAAGGVVGKKETTPNGSTFVNYDDVIYTTKAGEYFYTFDASGFPNVKELLKEIINTAEFVEVEEIVT